MGYPVVYLDDLDANTPLAFSLSALDDEVLVGKTMELTIDAVYLDADKPIAVTWSTSDPRVATVENGCVTGVAPGQVTITAVCGSLSDSVTLNVYAQLQSFELSASEVWMITKTTAEISLQNLQPASAQYRFTCSGQDTAVARVTIDGQQITIQGIRPGDTTVTMADEVSGLSAECIIHVYYPVTEIVFDSEAVKLLPGAMKALNATVTCGTQTVVNRLVTFTSSDPKVVEVSQSGIITGVGPGTATVTASYQDISAVCTVHVGQAAERMLLPAHLTQIGEEAFVGTAVECYVLPDGVVSIGSRAFADCENLCRVEIPSSATVIAEDTFEGCGELTIAAPIGSTAYDYANAFGYTWLLP